MIGTIIAAGVSAAATGIGALAKSRRARRDQQKIEAEMARAKAENRSFYDRYYNADATQFADNRAALTEAESRLRRQSQAAAGANAVVGGTNATAAAAKEQANSAYAEAVRGVAANAQQQKQHIQDQYRSNETAIRNGEIANIQQQSEANQQAISDAVNGVNTIASSFVANNTKKV